jgi:hypothetical protein
MNTHHIYNRLKTLLEGIAPVFQYTGQYQPGKGNVQYVSPAIYIQMPAGNMKVDYYPRGVRTVRKATITIHIVGYAPCQSHDNAAQEAALAAHQQRMDEVHAILDDLVLRDDQHRILTGALCLKSDTAHKYEKNCAITVMGYMADLWKYGE